VITRNFSFRLLAASALFAQGAIAADSALDAFPVFTLTRLIPAAPHRILTGSQFVELISRMDPRQRERAILKEILNGNVPSFLRNLVPVKLSFEKLTATIFVMPEYLAIGSDSDFLRIPMNLQTAAEIAARTGFILPTRKIVDAIYAQSAFHYAPEPMTPGPQMRSTEYYRIHNQKIEEQARSLGIPEGALVSGHKKDVVVTNLLAKNPGRIAIYGWHRLTGAPIQPLSTVHGTCYADYSHGIRLVSQTAMVNGQPRSIYDLLKDPVFSKVISDEGSIPNLREVLSHVTAEQLCGDIAQGLTSDPSRTGIPGDN
jgi:hypothetical protein